MPQSLQYFENFSETIEPQHVLKNIAPTFKAVLGSHRVGIATFDGTVNAFRNIALWDFANKSIQPGGVFESAGTAAAWVMQCSYPIFGKNIDDMQRYPNTHSYLVREKFTSNLILPIDMGRFGTAVIYLLAKSPNTFSEVTIPASIRLCEIVGPTLRAYLATREYIDGAEHSADCDQQATLPASEFDLSLAAHEKRHILDVVTRKNWVIEGPRGAARALGLAPSTLRNKMHKLGIQRNRQVSNS